MAQVRDLETGSWVDYPNVTMEEAGRRHVESVDPGVGSRTFVEVRLDVDEKIHRLGYEVTQEITCLNLRGDKEACKCS